MRDKQATHPAITPRALGAEALDGRHWSAVRPQATTRVFPGRHGRGLGLVELLADRWGYSGDRNGRSVFFELHWNQPD